MNIDPDTEETSILLTPLPKNKWNIYVDETYVNGSIITGFFAIPENREDAAFHNYRKKVFLADTEEEYKSREVSDHLNAVALKSVAHYDTIFHINESSMKQRRVGRKILTLASQIENYLWPIHALLDQISLKSQEIHQDNVDIRLLIDKRNDFESQTAFGTYANYFLREIERAYDFTKFNITLGLLDSKNSIGIQVADMLCGAYRKEILYRKFEPNIKLIPVEYTKDQLPEVITEDSILMRILGVLTIKENFKSITNVSVVSKPQPLKLENKSEASIPIEHAVPAFKSLDKEIKVPKHEANQKQKIQFKLCFLSFYLAKKVNKNSKEVADIYNIYAKSFREAAFQIFNFGFAMNKVSQNTKYVKLLPRIEIIHHAIICIYHNLSKLNNSQLSLVLDSLTTLISKLPKSEEMFNQVAKEEK